MITSKWKMAEIFDVAVFVCCIIFYFVAFMYSLTGNLTDYILTTWLIDYGDGFTRRGFLGYILSSLFEQGHKIDIIYFLCRSIHVLVSAIYLILLFKSNIAIKLKIMLLVSPALIMFNLYDHTAFGRIESVGFIVTALNCYSIKMYFDRASSSAASYTSIVCASNYLIFVILFLIPILLSVLAFVHEGVLLLVAPVNFLLTFLFLSSTFVKGSEVKSIFWTALAYMPLCLSVLFIVYFGKSGAEHAAAMCSSIKSNFPGIVKYSCSDLHGVLFFHQKNIASNMLYTINDIKNNLLGYSTYIMVGSILTAININIIHQIYSDKIIMKNISISSNDYSELYSMVEWLFVFPMACMIPLFFMGTDWGRWFYVPNMQFVIATLIFHNSKIYNHIRFPVLFPRFMEFFLSQSKLSVTNVSFVVLMIVLLGLRLPLYSLEWKKFLSPLVYTIMWLLYS